MINVVDQCDTTAKLGQLIKEFNRNDVQILQG